MTALTNTAYNTKKQIITAAPYEDTMGVVRFVLKVLDKEINTFVDVYKLTASMYFLQTRYLVETGQPLFLDSIQVKLPFGICMDAIQKYYGLWTGAIFHQNKYGTDMWSRIKNGSLSTGEPVHTYDDSFICDADKARIRKALEPFQHQSGFALQEAIKVPDLYKRHADAKTDITVEDLRQEYKYNAATPVFTPEEIAVSPLSLSQPDTFASCDEAKAFASYLQKTTGILYRVINNCVEPLIICSSENIWINIGDILYDKNNNAFTVVNICDNTVRLQSMITEECIDCSEKDIASYSFYPKTAKRKKVIVWLFPRKSCSTQSL